MSETRLKRDTFFINGAWVAPRDPHEPTRVFDSTDGSVFGTVPYGSVADADAAVAAAVAAFESWSQTPAWTRANFLKAVRQYLADRQEEIADVIAHEVGTPLRLAQRIQVGLPLATLDGFADIAQSMEWAESIDHSIVRREAVGVVAAITPWNYPLHQLVGKFGGALAAGCTMVAKPADVAPLSAFYLADACEAVGLPKGVFNVVSGPGMVLGERLASHPDVDMVSFTGSTRVGIRIAELAARNITRVALELGGKSASILLEDADMERAVRSSVGSCLLNSGQTCSAWTRLVVPRDRQDEVVALAIAAAQALTVGHPLDPTTRLGPLASQNQQQSVLKIIADARAGTGGKLVWEGTSPEDSSGYYVAPVIFADVDPDSTLAQDEVFGPVLSIIPHDGDDHAIAIANNSQYGLAGAVWSGDEERAMNVAKRMRTGQVDINGAAFNPRAPFGGFGKSGYGREFGIHGIEDFVELKSIQRKRTA